MDTLIPFFFIIQINNFRGDISGISAKKSSLITTCNIKYNIKYNIAFFWGGDLTDVLVKTQHCWRGVQSLPNTLFVLVRVSFLLLSFRAMPISKRFDNNPRLPLAAASGGSLPVILFSKLNLTFLGFLNPINVTML